MSPLIISGMHRSGTSAVARLALQLGMDMGANLLPAAEGNVYGHFEEAAFIRFHDALIARLFPQRVPFCEWLPVAGAEIAYTGADRAEAAGIWKEHQAAGGRAWKDPRTSLFLDLWTEVLGDAKVIVCLRHPYQVHLSLLRRGEPLLHVDYGAAIAGWTVYNQRILQAISALPRERFIVLDVETAFHAPNELAAELARFLGVPNAETAATAIAPGEFHFEDDMHEALDSFDRYFPETGALYRDLRRLAFPALIRAVPVTAVEPVSVQSPDARLIEFEEANGLRSRARKMLVRSIGVDRQRMLDLYKQVVKIGVEKDRLIEDLSRLNEVLKKRLVETGQPSAA